MNSSSVVASLAEAVSVANVKKLNYNELASVFVIVKFNYYPKDSLKLNTILFTLLLSFTNYLCNISLKFAVSPSF